MNQKVVTIGSLMKAGLIKQSTKVTLVTSNDLKELKLIKTIKKKDAKKISAFMLNKEGYIKKTKKIKHSIAKKR